ncbi:MAG: folate-binding protein, partial [Caldimonas sp.]
MNRHVSLAGFVSLHHLGVIRAHGPDASTFLQGQLTNDVSTLGPTQMRLAGFCSAKGRLQASFLVWKAADDDILLICAASVLPATLKRLSMFVMRARCKLTDATGDIPLTGFVGDSANAATGSLNVWETRAQDATTWARLPDVADQARCIVAGVMPASDANPPAIDLDSWRWLEVRSGIPLIEASTVDQFVPQMLNFELIGGVDFQKGCYPGQEVVARSQYRGTIKRRMFLFDCASAIQPGAEIFHSDDPGQPAGMVVNAAPGPSGDWSALVEVKLAALEGGTLRVTGSDGPVLRPADLPYAVA